MSADRQACGGSMAAGCGRRLRPGCSPRGILRTRTIRAQWCDGPVGIGRRLTRLLPEDAGDRQRWSAEAAAKVWSGRSAPHNREELAAALAITAECARTLCDAAILLAALERWAHLRRALVGDLPSPQWDGADVACCWRAIRSAAGRCTTIAGQHARLRLDAEGSACPCRRCPMRPTKRCGGISWRCCRNPGRTFFSRRSAGQPGTSWTRLHSAWRCEGSGNRDGRRFASVGGDYADALRKPSDTAVRAAAGAGRVVGAHLSGGLDSPAVAATAARLLAPSGKAGRGVTSVPREGYDVLIASADRRRRAGWRPPPPRFYPNMEHVLSRFRLVPAPRSDRNFILYDQPILNICNGVWVHGHNTKRGQAAS